MRSGHQISRLLVSSEYRFEKCYYVQVSRTERVARGNYNGGVTDCREEICLLEWGPQSSPRVRAGTLVRVVSKVALQAYQAPIMFTCSSQLLYVLGCITNHCILPQACNCFFCSTSPGPETFIRLQRSVEILWFHSTFTPKLLILNFADSKFRK